MQMGKRIAYNPGRQAKSPQEPRHLAMPRHADAPLPAGARAQAVYRALRRAIIEQALRAGTKLPEDAIGERFGVSRTLVREALTRLAIEGLVEIVPNRGAAVALPTLEEAHDAFEVRRGLERQMMERLAGRLSPQQCALLRDHIALEDEARARGGPESIRLAGEFHLLLAQMTGNALLERYIGEVSSRCALILSVYGRPHSPECAISEHSQILAALENDDAARAAALMDAHLQAVAERAVLARAQATDIRTLLTPFAASEGLAPAPARKPRP
jgi:DNA-binding GntR family transcriptional regulator